ncbi:PLP-dependent aminotransferase family protein [Pseudaquabacterium rugosum]|uniref:PLP-dependent aminotransferase family protein n=1 Tax=Pseudaquabacterium rugosum TaxID=2984194 RepID=A0ABU9B878_9BURK
MASVPPDRPATSRPLDAPARTPLQAQIVARFTALITSGRLPAGARVPSLRTLATELGVARGTVQAAYDRLVGEGLLEARGPAGTFVAAVTTGSAPARTQALRASPSAAPDADPLLDLDAPHPPALRMGLPALDAFPRKLWSRLVGRQARAMGTAALLKPEPAGLPRLREAIAVHLHRARGVAAQAGQVFIVPGYEAGLALTVAALLRAGDTAVVECPGFPPTPRLLGRLGLQVVHAPVDGEGLQVGPVRQQAPGARLVVVTPTHQSPGGMALTLARRRALLDWAAHDGPWIVEDDYDGEYHFRGPPLPALKSLDRDGRVIHAGTFSKVLFPGLRLAYVVVPPACVPAFEAAARTTAHGGCPSLTQAVVADFIEQGHLGRHVRRMRTLYAQRRAWLAEALAPLAPRGVRTVLGDGGMHLLIELPAGSDDRACARRAQAAGLGVLPLSAWRGQGTGPPALLAGFTNITSATVARQLVEGLGVAIG